MEEFSSMHIDDVKVYLTNRGISTSGKKKAELVALAYSCSILSIEIIKQDDVLKNVTDQQVEDLLNDLFILKPNSVLFKSIDGNNQKTVFTDRNWRRSWQQYRIL